MQLNIFIDWLHRRKISDSIITEFNLHVAFHPLFNDDCLVIPIEGIFNKYRRNPLTDEKPKYIYDKGSKITLYGWNKAKDYKTILITEGELDCLVAWSHNIPAISSTGGALSFQEEWGELLKDKEVILCFDNDKAGGEGMVRTMKYIPHAKVVFLPDSPKIKDISDYVTNGGDLNELIKTAVQLNTLEKVFAHRSERLSIWLSTFYHDAYIEEHSKPERKPVIRNIEQNDKIKNAKAYPIDALLSLKRGNAICPFHNEKTPSLHYYKDTNTCYCFGACGRAYDSIDIYRKIHGCSFNEAINNLQ